MIKRPLDKRFHDKVLEGIKVTTLRDKPWPVGKPIMLYHWSGKPYGSKQVDVSAVVVELSFTIAIRRDFDDGIHYDPEGLFPDGKRPLWECEGFDSQADMDAWFRPLVKRQSGIFKSLMRFRLVEGGEA